MKRKVVWNYFLAAFMVLYSKSKLWKKDYYVLDVQCDSYDTKGYDFKFVWIILKLKRKELVRYISITYNDTLW